MKEYFEWKAKHASDEIGWNWLEGHSEAVAIARTVEHDTVVIINCICYKPGKRFYVNSEKKDQMWSIFNTLEHYSQEISEEEFLRLAEFVYNDI